VRGEWAGDRSQNPEYWNQNPQKGLRYYSRRMLRMAESQSTPEFTVLDWLGCILVIFLILILFGWPIAAAVFSGMYEEMGASLPKLTIIVFKQWFSPLLGSFTALFFALQWFGWVKSNLRRRRIWVALSFVMALIALIICVIALHLPLFRMARAVA